MSHRRWIGLVLLVVLGLVTACGGGSSGTTGTNSSGQAQESVLTIANGADPTSLDPQKTPDVGLIHDLIFDTLVVRGADLKYHPDLATDWQVSPDGKEITFHLRKDVKFQDGTPFNADAVKFTFDRLVAKETASPAASWLGTYDHTDVIDPYTVKLVFKQPYAPIFNSLATSFCAILSPTAVQKEGDDFGKHPVGTGPYEVVSWKNGDSITLKKNPDYKWAPKDLYQNPGPANFDEIVFKLLPDENTRVLALQKGEVDISDVPGQSVSAISQDPNIQTFKASSQGITYLGINSSRAPWTDEKLRAAVAHAINRDEIVQVALNGLGDPQYGPIPSNVWSYDPSIKQKEYDYNIDAGKALLAQEGWKDTDGDGIVDKDGKPLTMDLLTYNTQPYPRLAEVLQNQIQKLGIKVNIKTLESATLLASTPKGDFDAIAIAYGWSDPDILYYFFHSSNLPKTNRVHFVDKQVDQLLEQGRTTVDPDAREKIYQQLQQVIDEKAPWVPLYSAVNVTAVRKDIEGVKMLPDGTLLLLDAKRATK